MHKEPLAPDERRARLAAPADLWVNEIFGPTIQGEGVSVGRGAAFLRVAFCAVGCIWCDTAYTWDFTLYDRATEARRMSVEQTLDAIRPCLPDDPQPLLIISGGEPLAQGSALRPLAERLREVGCRVEVETSGTIGPRTLDGSIDLFTVSPKLAHSGVPDQRRLRWPVLEQFAARADVAFKFVVRSSADLDEVAAIGDRLGLRSLMVMPLGTDTAALDAVIAELSPEVSARGWTWSDRLHIRRWGNERGR